MNNNIEINNNKFKFKIKIKEKKFKNLIKIIANNMNNWKLQIIKIKKKNDNFKHLVFWIIKINN